MCKRLVERGICRGGVFVVAVGVALGCVRAVAPLSVEQQINREQVVQQLLVQGVAALRGGDLRAAEVAFSLAEDMNPADSRVFDGLGAVAWRRCDLGRAKQLFQRSIVSDPNYSRPYAHLALVAAAEGDLAAAEALVQRALEKNPLNFHARELRALLLQTSVSGPKLSFANLPVPRVRSCNGHGK